MNKNLTIETNSISIILRLSMASLFAVAAINKFVKGLDGVVMYFQSVFEKTWLPLSLVTAQANVVAYVEIAIALWLLVGFKLRWAWIVTALFTISLALGMVVAVKYDVAANNYFYVLFCCVGIFFSQYDKLNVDAYLERNAK